MSATGGWYRVGERPEGKPQQRNVFEQKLAQQRWKPVAGRLTTPGVMKRKETVDTQSRMPIRLPTMDGFADSGLIASNTATASFEHAQRC